MTAQTPEILLWEGREVEMYTEPLEDYFMLAGRSCFEGARTDLWRGYVGTWEIREGRLYLIGLQGEAPRGGEGNLATIFPEYPERVFAHWYSGTLRVPQGQEIQHVHAGYASTFQSDLLISIERGVVTGTRVHQNVPLDRSQHVGKER